MIQVETIDKVDSLASPTECTSGGLILRSISKATNTTVGYLAWCNVRSHRLAKDSTKDGPLDISRSSPTIPASSRSEIPRSPNYGYNVIATSGIASSYDWHMRAILLTWRWHYNHNCAVESTGQASTHRSQILCRAADLHDGE